jgi:hypothetical protein
MPGSDESYRRLISLAPQSDLYVQVISEQFNAGEMPSTYEIFEAGEQPDWELISLHIQLSAGGSIFGWELIVYDVPHGDWVWWKNARVGNVNVIQSWLFPQPVAPIPLHYGSTPYGMKWRPLEVALVTTYFNLMAVARRKPANAAVMT